jgi:iron-sulfur cluster repair protein YtfE (RIC family)
MINVIKQNRRPLYLYISVKNFQNLIHAENSDNILIQRIHLENNILFPKIVNLEQFIFSEN